ncbi:hypothetical protein CC78DRAFT_583976 [Lojkania enalia]|uniref:Uncharacterized protein n=1 Tax=Lojkania enalia TaxID=147567 RepID=A0A9P4K1Y9_9PLEO|nr:hypothetical protein CC78DRAFT_583976 [Didymosphaeria enalia]
MRRPDAAERAITLQEPETKQPKRPSPLVRSRLVDDTTTAAWTARCVPELRGTYLLGPAQPLLLPSRCEYGYTASSRPARALFILTKHNNGVLLAEPPSRCHLLRQKTSC